MASADDYNNQGMTALMLACKGKGNLELVKYLHENGMRAIGRCVREN
jgi:hypothetical protein